MIEITKKEYIHPQDMGLAYLATPYSKYPSGIDLAFRDASALAARLLKMGIAVYSPIAHTHPLAINGDIDPLAHDIWLPFDETMMEKADCLIVAKMDGWNESRGIKHEIDFFENSSKAVFYLDPQTMEFTEE